VGAGPAGMMLGLLLARSGIQVTVLEQHTDFFRDFRGDTIHPSTLQLIYELGILPDFLRLPHQKTYQLRGYIENNPITIADFSKLQVQCPYIAFMPQWNFLDFLKQQAQQYPNFNLIMSCDAYDLLKNTDQICGIKAKTATSEIVINADLVIAADGRHSTIRDCSGLEVIDIGAPMDVLWFRLSHQEKDPNETFGKFIAGKIIIAISRGDYWQCGYVIPKGDATILQQQNIQDFRNKIVNALPFFSNRVQELKTWDDVKLLTVKIDRLKQWYLPGLLCIGDAAHAMSPVGGVGINLAIQDAVAAANILITPLKTKSVTLKTLAAVQQRRELAVKIIQKIQMLVQSKVIFKVLHKDEPIQIPWLIRQIQKLPVTRQFIGKLIGMGIRPEHIANEKS
jgi:2-polyprenyl-6-methoxyphenol hydroxylase-like FAD-dependent oxidoreductase